MDEDFENWEFEDVNEELSDLLRLASHKSPAASHKLREDAERVQRACRWPG